MLQLDRTRYLCRHRTWPYRDGLVDRTLGPEGFLPVQPGDVVGYSMSRVGRTGERDGIQLEPRREDEGEEMWYQSDADPLTTGSGSCLFSVGIEEGRTLRSFTNSAPILSVDIGKGEIANSTILLASDFEQGLAI